jgi:sugar lactone lactonase YvrE
LPISRSSSRLEIGPLAALGMSKSRDGATNFSRRWATTNNFFLVHQMKKKTLLHLFLSAAAITAPLAPSNGLSAVGDLYEADLGSGTIFKFAPDATKSTFASGLNGPVGLAFDTNGNLFEADTGTGTIFKFTPDGTQTTFASGLNGGPTGLAFDGSGNLFVGEFNSGVISKFTPDGTKSSFASGLTNVTGLAFDSSGNLFAADYGSGTIFKFTADGIKSTFASGLTNPGGLAFDSSGNLFEGDLGSGVIFKFAPDGTKTTFASGLSGPAGLAFDSSGNLFEADNTGGTVSKFAPDGTKSAFASGLSQPTLLAVEPISQKLRNVSARAFVQTGDNVLIGGFIVGGNALFNNMVVARAIGPSLSNSGISSPLQDPTLELHDASGAIVAFNDNWQDTQEAQIMATGLAPTDPHESAILAILPAGKYTAIVRGVGDTTGVALVEIYNPL